jgi:hypothetical protein
MKEIKDTTIDAVIESLDTFDDIYDNYVKDFVKKQPIVASFLEAEAGILNEQERDFLEYLALVIYKSIEKKYPKLPALSEGEIGEAEEQNWAIEENATGKTFTERLNFFFEAYPQEDLLAFVEDSLIDDPDDPEANMEFITEEGRMPMFIALKTIIDAFDKAVA